MPGPYPPAANPIIVIRFGLFHPYQLIQPESPGILRTVDGVQLAIDHCASEGTNGISWVASMPLAS